MRLEWHVRDSRRVWLACHPRRARPAGRTPGRVEPLSTGESAARTLLAQALAGAHLVRSGRTEPNAIAAITFTRKAADEMALRLRAMLPAGEAQAVWISTFHRLCGSLLREHGAAMGIPADFRIADEGEQIGVMRQCMWDAGVDTRVHKPQALIHRMSVIKNRMRVPANLDSWDADEHAARNARLAAAYRTALAEAASLDFDDLLLGAVRLLHEHSHARRAAGERFRRILVDEYQDTNLPQYVLLRQLSEDRDDVFVVGDPDQAIYGWRGAELRNILNFQRDFPAARRIDLQLAYRSSARLLEAAAAMIRHNADRLEHRLRAANPPGAPLAVHHAADPAAEAAFAVARAAARLERDDGSVAVLYRTNAQSRAFEDAFKRAGIRYRITGGQSFYERPEIRDALACLQAGSDPDADDEAMRRFVDLPPHPRTGQKAAAQIDRMGAPTFWRRAALALRAGALPDRHGGNLRLRFELAAVLAAAARRLPLDDLVDTVLGETGYLQAVRTSADPDAADRLDNLAELASDAAAFRRDARQPDAAAADERLRLLADFLGHCRPMRAPDRSRGADVRVTLSTLHGAKGLEFDTVVIGGFDRRTPAAPQHRRRGRRRRNRNRRGTPPGLRRHDPRQIRALPERAGRHRPRKQTTTGGSFPVPGRHPRGVARDRRRRRHHAGTAGAGKAAVRTRAGHSPPAGGELTPPPGRRASRASARGRWPPGGIEGHATARRRSPVESRRGMLTNRRGKEPLSEGHAATAEGWCVTGRGRTAARGVRTPRTRTSC